MEPWIHKGQLAPERCHQEVGDYSLNWPHYHQCYRKWKVEVGGNRFCTQHDPVKVEEKRKARWYKYNAESNTRVAKLKRQAITKAACTDVPNELLPPGIVRKLINYVYEMDNQALMKEIEG